MVSIMSNTLVLGLLVAAPLILASMGFTLIYALNGFLNVAYGENLTMGAFFAIIFNNILGFNFYLSIIPAAILSGVLSVITYFLVFRPAINRGVGSAEMIILSVGVSFMIRYTARVVFGIQFRGFKIGSPTYLKVFGIGITSIQITALVLVAVISVGLYVFIHKTNYGEKIRALADNKEIAMISGINPVKVSIFIWFVSGVVGGLAGIFFGVFSVVHSYLGWELILIIMMICVVGGAGSIRGALLVSIGIGLITTAIALVSKPLYGEIAMLVMFIVFLRAKRRRVL